ncbi:hypothetical protein J6590_036475, partial [Homalodisca vitripennis]
MLVFSSLHRRLLPPVSLRLPRSLVSTAHLPVSPHIDSDGDELFHRSPSAREVTQLLTPSTFKCCQLLISEASPKSRVH